MSPSTASAKKTQNGPEISVVPSESKEELKKKKKEIIN